MFTCFALLWASTLHYVDVASTYILTCMGFEDTNEINDRRAPKLCTYVVRIFYAPECQCNDYINMKKLLPKINFVASDVQMRGLPWQLCVFMMCLAFPNGQSLGWIGLVCVCVWIIRRRFYMRNEFEYCHIGMMKFLNWSAFMTLVRRGGFKTDWLTIRRVIITGNNSHVH